MRPKLVVSFSGGKTSGYMTKMILDHMQSKYEVIVLFANTGQENEETLEFVHNCDTQMGFNTVWLEAVVHPELRKGTTHRITDFANADRSGEIFEEMIKKYGIPNSSFPHCTRELKLRPITSYLREIDWNDRLMAVGIREDEKRRVSKSAGAENIVYPLIDWFPTDKIDVNDWWAEQQFDLELTEHRGNCAWCWKKSFNKHFTLISETPEIYAFPARMERDHHRTGRGTQDRGRVFFRGKRSTSDLFRMAQAITEGVTHKQAAADLDANGGCSESCELYPTE